MCTLHWSRHTSGRCTSARASMCLVREQEIIRIPKRCVNSRSYSHTYIKCCMGFAGKKTTKKMKMIPALLNNSTASLPWWVMDFRITKLYVELQIVLTALYVALFPSQFLMHSYYKRQNLGWGLGSENIRIILCLNIQ